MISLRSAEGISAGEIYKEKIRKASSSNVNSSHSVCQFGGRDGITSGMNNPLSGARPLRTTSSKESCVLLAGVTDWKGVHLRHRSPHEC